MLAVFITSVLVVVACMTSYIVADFIAWIIASLVYSSVLELGVGPVVVFGVIIVGSIMYAGEKFIFGTKRLTESEIIKSWREKYCDRIEYVDSTAKEE